MDSGNPYFGEKVVTMLENANTWQRALCKSFPEILITRIVILILLVWKRELKNHVF